MDSIKRLRLRAGKKFRPITQREKYFTRVQMSGQELPLAEDPGILYISHHRSLYVGDEVVEAERVKRNLNNLSQDSLCVFSDGSACGPARSAWGHVIYRQLGKLESDSGILPGPEIYDTEVCGALKGLQAALMIAGNAPIKVLLDNQTAVQALRTGRTISSLEAVETFSALCNMDKRVEIWWSPGHSGISGNKEADKLVRSALSIYPIHPRCNTAHESTNWKFTFAAIRRMVNSRSLELIENWWKNHRSKRYEDLDLKMRRKRPPELALARWVYHRLVAARTGHGDFADYHRRFRHENADCNFKCGREKRPRHFAECQQAVRL